MIHGESGRVNYHPLEAYKRLIAAVVTDALNELARGDPVEQAGSLIWLSSDEARAYFELLGLGDSLAAMDRLNTIRRRVRR